MTDDAVTDAPVEERKPAASRPRIAIAAAVIGAAIALVVWRGLDEATLYFRTADEAVAQRESLGAKRFRLEGTVVAGSVRAVDGGVVFEVEANDTRVGVRHAGDPPELFRAGIPVVLEGRFVRDVFESDRILVRHSEQYRARNPERVRDYTPSKPRSR